MVSDQFIDLILHPANTHIHTVIYSRIVIAAHDILKLFKRGTYDIWSTIYRIPDIACYIYTCV